MTDQSRVEAVADAVGNARNRQGNFVISFPGDALAIAQAATEANDDWLNARGFGIAPKIMTDEMAMHAGAAQSLSSPFNLKEMMIRGWNTAFSFAPSPEEIEQ